MRKVLLPAVILLMATPVAAQTCPQQGKNAPMALHEAWMMEGWERNEGDPEFVFAEKMNRYYDLGSPTGVFYDNFAPGETQLFDNAAVYGANWEDLQNGARSILHALTGGNDQIVGDSIALTTLGFVGRIERLDREVIAFGGRSQLGWGVHAGRLEDPAGTELRLDGRARGDRTLLPTIWGGGMTHAAALHTHLGMWMTADGRIRHELLANGRYVEARGGRERAYQGRYEVTGNHIEYWDDSDFTADGDFVDGVLHHAGMVLYRR
jgi:hypothetical protein